MSLTEDDKLWFKAALDDQKAWMNTELSGQKAWMKAELGEQKAWMKAELGEQKAWLKAELSDQKGWVDGQLKILDAKIEHVETSLLTEFHKWASPLDMRVRGHSQMINALDLEITSLADRVSKLENRLPDTQ